MHERIENADETRREYTTTLSYDVESKPERITYETADAEKTQRLEYGYDGLSRMKSRKLYLDEESTEATYESEYRYIAGIYGKGSTTPLIRKIRQTDGEYEYWYDEVGSITRERYCGRAQGGGELSFEGSAISSDGTLTLEAGEAKAIYNRTYSYDQLGQLTRVNDEREKATWTYRYDLGGNILEKRRYAYTEEADLSERTPEETIPYVYGDASWKDLLTSFDGKAITYDEIGNPISYDGRMFTWKTGRRLASVASETEGIQITYVYSFIYFYNNERIQLKTKLTPLEKRRQFA